MTTTPSASQMPQTNHPEDSIEFAWTMAQSWKADMETGEQSFTVATRIEETFRADPILAMFVPEMRKGFVNALVFALTVPGESDQHSRTVAPDMDPMTLEVKACEVFDASPLSVLSDKARKHLISTLLDGLYPHATIAARTS